MMIIVALIVLGILIFVHELGHFLVAKWNNVGVLEFALGFGKRIFSKKIGGTVYSLRIIPLGGFVKMTGDDPHDVYGEHDAAGHNTDHTPHLESDLSEFDQESLSLLKDKSKWFLSKGFFAKFSIVFAGPLFNLLFALFAAIGSFYFFGKVVPTELSVIGDVVPGYPAEKAGVLSLDKIISIDGKSVSSWKEMAETIGGSRGKELLLHIKRSLKEDGKEIEKEVDIKIAAAPESSEIAVVQGTEPRESYKIGIMPDTHREPVSLGEAALYGTLHVAGIAEMTARGLWGMIRGAISPKNIAGPIFIFQEAGRNAKKGIDRLLDFMVFLSVSLAILNLLPVPVLDGGHILFFIIEAIKGSPLSLRAHRVAQSIGMAMLLLLMIFAMGNDVLRLLR